MLALYTNRAARSERPADLDSGSLPPDAVWIDLASPDSDEIAFVERTTGLAMPSFEELSEIENSSRLRAAKDALYLSAPLVLRGELDQPLTTVVGFVLTRRWLITIRFAELPSFATVAERNLPADSPPLTSSAVFSDLMEAVVDHLADALERIASELDKLSHWLFRTQPAALSTRRRS